MITLADSFTGDSKRQGFASERRLVKEPSETAWGACFYRIRSATYIHTLGSAVTVYWMKSPLQFLKGTSRVNTDAAGTRNPRGTAPTAPTR